MKTHEEVLKEQENRLKEIDEAVQKGDLDPMHAAFLRGHCKGLTGYETLEELEQIEKDDKWHIRGWHIINAFEQEIGVERHSYVARFIDHLAFDVCLYETDYQNVQEITERYKNLAEQHFKVGEWEHEGCKGVWIAACDRLDYTIDEYMRKFVDWNWLERLLNGGKISNANMVWRFKEGYNCERY